jgi:fatty acid synthase subunit alpha
MEAYGEFSLEGCVELAWLVGLVRPHAGALPGGPRGARHIGWVDAQTGEPVFDHEVKRKYEKLILAHAGVRLVEPALFEGYDPDAKRVWSKVAVDKDLPPVEVASLEAASEMQRALGGPDKCDVWVQPDGAVKARVRAGAVIAIPRAFRFDRFVVGQIPTGWSGERLGVPADIAKAVVSCGRQRRVMAGPRGGGGRTGERGGCCSWPQDPPKLTLPASTCRRTR